MNLEHVELPALPDRDREGHKGTFGTVGVIGGCTGERVMLGSAALVALGALRSGCGLATIAAPDSILPSILEIAFEATGIALPSGPDGELQASKVAELVDAHLASARALAVGPGFGLGEAQRQVVLRLVAREEQSLVLDADALTLLAASEALQHDVRAPAILTPHPGEFARLAESLGMDARPETDEERIDAAALLASRLGVVVLLKGPRTVVTDGIRVHVNRTGNAALATGGSGDVLTGLCAGFVAQFGGRLDLFQCAGLAAHVHGLAADLIVAQRGTERLIARELLEAIPAAILETGNE
jgi:ADP-dependent NAD(P)H-hydrate dehydratase